jgi:hypothetical protein
MMNGIVLNVANKPFMLSVIMLNVVMLSVVMLNVVAPIFFLHIYRGPNHLNGILW